MSLFNHPVIARISLANKFVFAILVTLLVLFSYIVTSTLTIQENAFVDMVGEAQYSFVEIKDAEEEELVRAEQDKLKLIVALFLEEASEAIVTRNTVHLSHLSELLLKDQDFTYIGFVDAKNELIFEAGKRQEKTLTYDVRQGGSKVGMLLLNHSRSRLDQQLAKLDQGQMKSLNVMDAARVDAQKHIRNRLILKVFIVAMVVWFLILILFQKLINQPLKANISDMNRLADGEMHVEIQNTQRQDEIGDIAHALEVFKNNAIENRKLSAAQLEEQKRKLEAQENVKRLIKGFDGEITSLLERVFSSTEMLRNISSSMTATSEKNTKPK